MYVNTSRALGLDVKELLISSEGHNTYVMYTIK